MDDLAVCEAYFHRNEDLPSRVAFERQQTKDQGVKLLFERLQQLKQTGYYVETASLSDQKAKYRGYCDETSSQTRSEDANSSLSSSSEQPKPTKQNPSGARRKAKTATKERQKKRCVGKDKERLNHRGGGSGYIPVMLAHNYDPDKHDPTGWLMSEKLDGVRCYWDGANMYTRTGKPFYAPDSFIARLPDIALDGELWTSRDDF